MVDACVGKASMPLSIKVRFMSAKLRTDGSLHISLVTNPKTFSYIELEPCVCVVGGGGSECGCLVEERLGTSLLCRLTESKHAPQVVTHGLCVASRRKQNRRMTLLQTLTWRSYNITIEHRRGNHGIDRLTPCGSGSLGSRGTAQAYAHVST